MEEVNRRSLNLNFTAESAQLERILLGRHRPTVREEKVENSADCNMSNVNWVVSKDFTIEVGKRQIGEYIKTWEMPPCWLYSLDFLYSTEEEHHTFYHYRARFSTSTPRKPIQGTAGVYFVVDISKVKPPTLPVEVHFIVESNRLVHTPGMTRFKEKWLADVIESKTLLRRAFDLSTN
ncbi:A-kinase anchor protein 14 [Micropterus salmoides]|uniref:A-kinase anchor protein 14 n=1 Tax=Micropterus salmoides TaxID=27706 RepID=UPI0018EA3904|nr:A-kinase anchor protein 14 [Micropterus salmoides]XP_045927768.1 A-kinase anchor protein 14 [Micropterus dolomieu]